MQHVGHAVMFGCRGEGERGQVCECENMAKEDADVDRHEELHLLIWGRRVCASLEEGDLDGGDWTAVTGRR